MGGPGLRGALEENGLVLMLEKESEKGHIIHIFFFIKEEVGSYPIFCLFYLLPGPALLTFLNFL